MSGNAQKAVIGQLTEDAIRDVALLQGGKIVLLYAPDRQEWFKRSTGYNGTYSDIAVLPGDFAGDPDTLLALRPEGLVRLQWDPAQRVLEDEGPPLASGDWCGARLLRVVPGVEGLDNVAAVTSGGDVVYAVLDTGSFQDGGTLDTTVVNAIAFEALDLHGNGDIEYAFDDGTGLRVFSSGGSPIPTCPPNASPEPRLLRLPEAAGKDALVWVSSLLPSIPQALTVVRMGTTSLTFENAIQLPVPSAEFALADYYGDTKLDLLGVSSVDSAVRVLQNQHVFGGPQAHTFGFTPPGPPLETFYFDASQVYGGTAPPALAAGDLDGDGDADLVLAGHAGGSGLVKVFLSDGIDEDLFRPEVDECVRKAPSCLAFYDSRNTEGFELNIYQQVGGGTDVRVETWVLDAAISQWSA
jgi:hypothetical protein